MLVEEKIYQFSLTTPEKTAIIHDGNRVSYSCLWDNIINAVRWYKSKGFSSGDRIILAAEKNIDFVYAYFGAHLAGLICVPIDTESNPARLKRIVEATKPVAIIGNLHHAEDLGLKTEKLGYIDSSRNVDVQFPPDDCIADLMFTTGTTGMPKGVAISFGNQAAAAESINSFIGNSADDVELLALPISHSFGLGRMRCVLSKGATLVLLGSFASMKKFYAAISDYAVSGFGMVPASWAYISKMSGDRISKFASQLKYIEIGSAYMPINEKDRLRKLLPTTRICMHYGLTEASRSAFICFNDDTDHLDSIGKGAPGVDIKVFNELGQELPCETDGEICVAGKHVCLNYWNTSDYDFNKDFYGAYFRTGDWGHYGKDGYLFLVSRKKELINVGGKKVSPLEVEEVLNSFPAIKESACVASPDPVMGEVVKAFVVSDEDIDEELIKKQMAKVLENYKIPSEIRRIKELPKTSSGKLQRLQLKQDGI